MDIIPVLRPLLPKTAKLAPYLEQIDANRYYSNGGPLLQAFEKRLAAHFGVDPATLATSANGTLALVQTLRAMGAEKGTLCALPSWTFAATPAAAMAAGLTPFFMDVDPATWELRPDTVRALLKKHKIGAVMPVAPFGAPIDLKAWEDFAVETKIPVLIDAAASFDSQSRLPPSKIPVMVSLHATKALGIGEGAVVLAGDPLVARQIRMHGNFGFDGTREALLPGINAKMNEYSAAIGLAALDEWDVTREDWRKLSDSFESRAESLPSVSCMPDFNRAWVSSYGLVVLNAPCDLARLQAGLKKRGVGTVAWWGEGCHMQEAYASCPRAALPVTEELGRSVLGLPFWRGLSDAQMDHVFAALAALLAEERTAATKASS